MRLLNFYLLITLVISTAMSISVDLNGKIAKWDGGAKPNNNWSTPSNWQSGSVPTRRDTVVLDNSNVNNDYTVVIDTRTIAKVNSIIIDPDPAFSYEITLTSANGSKLEVHGSNDPVIEVHNRGVYANLTDDGIPSDGSGSELSQDEIKIEGTAFRNPGEYVVQNSSSVNFDNLIGAIAPGSSSEGKVVFNSATQSLDVSGKTLHTGLTFKGSSGTTYDVPTKSTGNFTIKGDLTIESGVTYDATGRASGNLKLEGDLTNNGTLNLNSGNQTLKLTGSNQQTIDGITSVELLEVDNSNGISLASDLTIASGGKLTWKSGEINNETSNEQLILEDNVTLDLGSSDKTLDCDLDMNNSNGITLSQDLTLEGSNNVTFTNGVITMNSGATFFFDENATYSGSFSDSYIDGPTEKAGNSNFKFPIGKDGQYAPIEITNLSGIASFTAEYFKNQSSNYKSSPTNFNSISQDEYWTLSPAISGSADADVTLYWNSSGSVNHGIDGNSLGDLRVARYDGPNWVDEGPSSGGSGSSSSGSITSDQVTSFSQFTFGSSSKDNPLPVELLDFTVSPQQAHLQLNWATASETNNKHFLVQKRVGEQWKNIGTVEGNGTTIEKQNYTFRDGNVQPGHTYYYRLKQADFNGSFEYSAIKTGKLQQDNAPGASNLAVYPNPVARDVLYYRFSSADQQAELLQVINARDEVVHQQSVAARGRQQKGRLSMGSLQPGIYLLQVVGQKTTMQERFIKE